MTKNETRPHPTATPEGCRKHARGCVAEAMADERRPLDYQGGPEHRAAMRAEARRLFKLADEIEAWEAAR